MYELDEIDKRILSILKENSRISFSELARQFGLSDVAMRKRVEKLVEKGVIKRFTCDIDYSKVGKPISAFIFVKTRADRTEEVLNAIGKMSDIEYVYQVMGEFDIIVKVNVSSISSLKELSDNQISSIHGVLEVKPNIIYTKVE